MPYLIYSSHSAAHDRSRREAEARGCDMVGTTHWWPVVEGPDGAAVIATDADDPPRSDGKAPVATPRTISAASLSAVQMAIIAAAWR